MYRYVGVMVQNPVTDEHRLPQKLHTSTGTAYLCSYMYSVCNYLSC